jgi:isopentenyldiphosphate isomerase
MKRIDAEKAWFRRCKRAQRFHRLSTEEQVDYYDGAKKLLGVASKSDVHRLGLWHRSFHCWIAYLEGDSPKVVMQMRGKKVQDFKNKLDISAAGHYQTREEDFRGGLRELKEELSLVLRREQVGRIGRRMVNEVVPDLRRNCEWQDIGLHVPDDRGGIRDRLRPNPEEVESVWELPVRGVLKLLRGRATSVKAIRCGVKSNKSDSMAIVENFGRDNFIESASHYLAHIMCELEKHLSPRYHPSQGQMLSLGDGSTWEDCDGGM